MEEVHSREEMLEYIFDIIERLIQLNVEKIVREKEFGTKASLKEFEEPFLRLKNLLIHFEKVNYSLVPNEPLKGIMEDLTNIFETIRSTVNYNPLEERDKIIRNELFEKLSRDYNSLFQKLAPLLAFSSFDNNLFEKKYLEKDVLLNQIIQRVNETDLHIQAAYEQIEKTLENAQAAAGKIVISKYATIFLEEAKEHSDLAKAWLNRSYGFLAAITIFAILAVLMLFNETINNSIKEGGNTFLIQLTISKAIILAALFYGLSICTRNYKAHRHNAVVNKHRQNALTTFEVFSEAADSDQTTKNAVLLEATRTIFSSQQTGYLNNESDGESPNKVIEIIKNVTSTSK
jgi:hypothetical protein